MRRATGITLTAAALSVTLGVLVGTVITIGARVRAASATQSTSSSTATSSEFADPTAGNAGNQSPSPDAPDGTPVSLLSSSVPATALPAGVVRSSRPVTVSVPTKPRPSTHAVPRRTNNTTTSKAVVVITTLTLQVSTSALPRTTNQLPSGMPKAGGPCSILGEKGTVADGSNVFCQNNFARPGTLAWRAVVDGGGCLSRRMTGKGTAGRDYVCRADDPGTNRWHSAQ